MTENCGNCLCRFFMETQGEAWVGSDLYCPPCYDAYWAGDIETLNRRKQNPVCVFRRG